MARILLLCWRDSAHPQGGGSERYLEHVGRHLAARGHDVVYRTARYPGSARAEIVDGIRYTRGGGRLSVYPRALAWLVLQRLRSWRRATGPYDVVIDTHNGVPFFAALVAGAPTLVLSHHCHREQWPVAGPVLARTGWWIESWLSPRVHRRTQWLTVSLPSAAELAGLGVPEEHIAVVRNGVDPLPDGMAPGGPETRAPGPRLVVLSRLVPHKHVDDALEVLARLRPTHPDLRLDVIGGGWWADELAAAADRLGIARAVTFHGHVSERQKHRLLAAATLHLMPSRKEGWGLAVMEAAQHRVPTVGYQHAAGLRDSIVDGVTGLLVADLPELVAATEELLADGERLDELGRAAAERSKEFSWPAAGAAVEWLLGEVRAGRRYGGVVSGGRATGPALGEHLAQSSRE